MNKISTIQKEYNSKYHIEHREKIAQKYPHTKSCATKDDFNLTEIFKIL